MSDYKTAAGEVADAIMTGLIVLALLGVLFLCCSNSGEQAANYWWPKTQEAPND